MKKRSLIKLATLLAILVLVISVSFVACGKPEPTTAPSPSPTSSPAPAPAAAEKIVWKAQSYAPLQNAAFGYFPAEQAGQFATLGGTWTKWIESASEGRLEIEWHDPGALFPMADSDLAIADGIADMVLSCGLYYPTRIPEAVCDFTPLAILNLEDELELFFEYGYYDLMKEIMASKGLVYEYIATDAMQSFGTAFDCSTLASFKGKKIRSLASGADFVAAIGGSPVSLPFAEQYMGMKLGTVEGWTSSPSALEAINMKEVTDYFISKPILYAGPAHLLINPDSFNALPDDIQKLITDYGRYVQIEGAIRQHQQAAWCLNNAASEYGIKIVQWSDADIKTATQITRDQVYPKLAAPSPECAKLMDMFIKQLEDHGRL